jgi:hypothetical protein
MTTKKEFLAKYLADKLMVPYPQDDIRVQTQQPARELEILFYGMMCFDPLPDGSGYRVLFPNGLDLSELTDIPIHTAGVWIRDRDVNPTVRWSAFSYRNDFFVDRKDQLKITGLVKTPLNTDELEGRVTNLQQCDPNFKIRENPDAVIEMIVDRGTLSAHVVNDRKMIAVKWAVQVEDEVRFTFGDDFVEIPPEVTQVYLANVSPSEGNDPQRHFQLFRKLSTEPTKSLRFVGPPDAPVTTTLALNDPTFQYPAEQPKAPAAPNGNGAAKSPKRTGTTQPIVGPLPQVVEAVPLSPDIVCSPVVSRPRASAIGG